MRKILVLFMAGVCILLAAGSISPGFYESVFSASWSGEDLQSGTVIGIQRSLKSLGYYKGNINGVLDSQTCSAVKGFQESNGIKADGRVDTKTLNIIGARAAAQQNKGKNQTTSKDASLMARAINGEARGEPYIGAVAVGAVIMNRTRDPRFPNTVAGVIYQPGAFTAVTDGQINANLEPQATKAARDALNGWDPSGGAVFYYNPAKTTNKWIWSRPVIKVIGKHKFCK